MRNTTEGLLRAQAPPPHISSCVYEGATALCLKPPAKKVSIFGASFFYLQL